MRYGLVAISSREAITDLDLVRTAWDVDSFELEWVGWELTIAEAPQPLLESITKFSIYLRDCY